MHLSPTSVWFYDQPAIELNILLYICLKYPNSELDHFHKSIWKKYFKDVPRKQLKFKKMGIMLRLFISSLI